MLAKPLISMGNQRNLDGQVTDSGLNSIKFMKSFKTPLFKPVDESIRKSTAILVRMSKADAETIRESAHIRNLSVAEFMRRAALGRKADVRYETQIVLQLSDAVRAIRQIHKAMVDQGMTPPEELWLPIIQGAEDAIIRITK